MAVIQPCQRNILTRVTLYLGRTQTGTQKITQMISAEGDQCHDFCYGQWQCKVSQTYY